YRHRTRPLHMPLEQITAATWNVGGCRLTTRAGEWSEDISYFADHIQSTDADVVLLQEAHVFPDGRQPSQVALLGEIAGFPYTAAHAVSQSHLVDGAQLALGILSRWGFRRVEFNRMYTPRLTVPTARGNWTLHSKGQLI